MCATLDRGTIVAIDRSARKVARARAENREHVAAGRARIEHTTLARAPDMLGEGAANGFMVEEQRTARFTRSAGLCIVARPERRAARVR
ncbi:MAG: hypothetical protein DIU78_017355 [Pseudomonadota bacterium]|nr:MAG: hypothetical protein DIU78_25665 [Pseudomonadota bacterium]